MINAINFNYKQPNDEVNLYNNMKDNNYNFKEFF